MNGGFVKKFVQVCNKSIGVGVKLTLTEYFDSIMRNALKLIVLIVIMSELNAIKARLFLIRLFSLSLIVFVVKAGQTILPVINYF